MSSEAPSPAIPDGMQRVGSALQACGHAHAPLLLPVLAHTAQQAADALDVQLGQIAKSIIFAHTTASGTDRAVLVITAGDKRVQEKKVQALVGPIRRADADFVKTQTGFSIGGVSPLAHRHTPITLLDLSLQRYTIIWAAAGHPQAVFQLAPTDLDHLCSGAQWAEVT